MLALFLFIICDVISRRIRSQSTRAVGCNGRRMKSTLASAEELRCPRRASLHRGCHLVLRERFWQLRDAIPRVKGVRGDDGQQVKLLTVAVPVCIEIHVVGVRTIGVSERDLLHNPRVVSGRSDQHVEAAAAAHS